MKQFLIWFVMTAAAAARADLVMHEQAELEGVTNLISITVKIHGDKIRQDLYGLPTGDMSLIKDAKTGNTIVLLHQQKLFSKPNAKTTDTQSPEAALSKPKATGNSATVGGYDAQVYTWAADRNLWNGTNGMIETLWVAKDFPNFDKIKFDLVKLDRANISFPGKGMQPEISTLPGMVLKSNMIAKIGEAVETITITLLTAKEEPVDPADFEVPNDYKEWNPAEPTPSTTPAK